MPIHNETDVQRCYERWGPMALNYCQLFLGDQAEAESATQQGFLAFLRNASDPCCDDGLPVGLMKAVVRAATNLCSPFEENLDTGNFESCVRLLPWHERAVFLLRSTFGLTADQVAEITTTTREAVNRTWIDAMLRIRKLWLKR